MIEKVKHGDFDVEATWPLGSAIETVSGMSSTKLEVPNMYQFGLMRKYIHWNWSCNLISLSMN